MYMLYKTYITLMHISIFTLEGNFLKLTHLKIITTTLLVWKKTTVQSIPRRLGLTVIVRLEHLCSGALVEIYQKSCTMSGKECYGTLCACFFLIVWKRNISSRLSCLNDKTLGMELGYMEDNHPSACWLLHPQNAMYCNGQNTGSTICLMWKQWTERWLDCLVIGVDLSHVLLSCGLCIGYPTLLSVAECAAECVLNLGKSTQLQSLTWKMPTRWSLLTLLTGCC